MVNCKYIFNRKSETFTVVQYTNNGLPIKSDLNNSEQFEFIIVPFINGRNLCHILELMFPVDSLVGNKRQIASLCAPGCIGSYVFSVLNYVHGSNRSYSVKNEWITTHLHIHVSTLFFRNVKISLSNFWTNEIIYFSNIYVPYGKVANMFVPRSKYKVQYTTRVARHILPSWNYATRSIWIKYLPGTDIGTSRNGDIGSPPKEYYLILVLRSTILSQLRVYVVLNML